MPVKKQSMWPLCCLYGHNLDYIGGDIEHIDYESIIAIINNPPYSLPDGFGYTENDKTLEKGKFRLSLGCFYSKNKYLLNKTIKMLKERRIIDTKYTKIKVHKPSRDYAIITLYNKKL